jgi:hypothetical protein
MIIIIIYNHLYYVAIYCFSAKTYGVPNCEFRKLETCRTINETVSMI